MTTRHFFGYGSLVNLRTHNYGGAHPISLHGWQRVWLSSSRRDRSFLSVQPAQGVTVQGLLAEVPDDGWAALDKREFAYARHRLDVSAMSGTHAGHSDVQIYQGDPAFIAPQHIKKPILLSYLDVVVQGYLKHFGTEGVDAFFATTEGWGTPIRNDRHAPQYARTQNLSSKETALVDWHLTKLSAVIEHPEGSVMSNKGRAAQIRHVGD